MTKTCTPQERAQQSDYFTNIMIPDDFRKLIEGPASVTLEVDATTAVYPWEMAGYKKISNAFFLGTNIAISRQFRTLLSPPPTSPPALNSKLKALIIADPAPGIWSLPGARAEGAAVVEVLQQAQVAWGDQYQVEATVRIGSKDDPANQRAQQILQELRKNSIVKSAELCDPLQLAMLLVNDQYDLVHYAGHGICDSESGRTGWVFAADCVLSAKDIFSIRQVPRLVFANACFSSVAIDRNEERKHMAGLAQAFFGRGIPNYIGAGWKVDDLCAVECARWFYATLMGLNGPRAGDGIAPSWSEATIGKALKKAREMAQKGNPELLELGSLSALWPRQRPAGFDCRCGGRQRDVRDNRLNRHLHPRYPARDNQFRSYANGAQRKQCDRPSRCRRSELHFCKRHRLQHGRLCFQAEDDR